MPACLAGIPRDPFDGQPLRYTRAEHGYKVYSVGANAIDHGGEWNVQASDLIIPPRGLEPKDVGNAIDIALRRRGQ